ncbi:hypothetical protein CEXT_218821 [Caerostris extrusa]|uniref:Uncharacterized protein n=1 Tax=Caerostris extrusa TaxID=172846 RepID=A0AAV4VK40_CAEEX|nr:hypothetical protein CEXT_218821 [Caerostris extrusa]
MLFRLRECVCKANFSPISQKRARLHAKVEVFVRVGVTAWSNLFGKTWNGCSNQKETFDFDAWRESVFKREEKKKEPYSGKEMLPK